MLPAPVLRICEQEDFNIKQTDIDALIKEEALDFEHFYDQEDEEDRLDTLALLDEVNKVPPPPPEKEHKEQLKEQILNEDKEDNFVGVMTRSQKQKIIEKKLRFDLEQNDEQTKT